MNNINITITSLSMNNTDAPTPIDAITGLIRALHNTHIIYFWIRLGISVGCGVDRCFFFTAQAFEGNDAAQGGVWADYRVVRICDIGTIARLQLPHRPGRCPGGAGEPRCWGRVGCHIPRSLTP